MELCKGFLSACRHRFTKKPLLTGHTGRCYSVTLFITNSQPTKTSPSPSMASGGTVCVATGEGSTYCMPSRGPLAAMPTPRPEHKRNDLVNQPDNQQVSQSVRQSYSKSIS